MPATSLYTVVDEMDRLLNDVFYRMSQLRSLGELFLRAEPHEYSAGCFIEDYCAPALVDINSLQKSIDTLKSCLEAQL